MKKEHRASNSIRNERGMTLVEVLAVIVLIGLIMTVVLKGVIGKSGSAKAELNVVKMKKVQSYLSQYRLKYNAYPSKLDDLVKSSGKTSGSSATIFTQLAEEDEIKDIWGAPYIYRTENNNRSYLLKSLGADGVAGGDSEDQDVELRP